MTPFPEAVYGGCCLWGCSQKPAWCQQGVSNAATELEARKSKSLWAGRRLGGGVALWYGPTQICGPRGAITSGFFAISKRRNTDDNDLELPYIMAI